MVHTEFLLAREKATIRTHALAEVLRGAPPPRQEAPRAPCRPSKYVESLTKRTMLQRNGFQRRHVAQCAHATRRIIATTTAPPLRSRAALRPLGPRRGTTTTRRAGGWARTPLHDRTATAEPRAVLV